MFHCSVIKVLCLSDSLFRLPHLSRPVNRFFHFFETFLFLLKNEIRFLFSEAEYILPSFKAVVNRFFYKTSVKNFRNRLFPYMKDRKVSFWIIRSAFSPKSVLQRTVRIAISVHRTATPSRMPRAAPASLFTPRITGRLAKRSRAKVSTLSRMPDRKKDARKEIPFVRSSARYFAI